MWILSNTTSKEQNTVLQIIRTKLGLVTATVAQSQESIIFVLIML